MRKIALVIVDNEVLALKGIYALKNLGYKVCILANNKSSTLAHSRYVSSFDVLPPAVSDEILLDRIREFGADIIFPAEIDSAGRLYRLSILDSGLPIFPCSSGNLLDALDNKDRFISLISDYRINHPKSILLSPPF